VMVAGGAENVRQFDCAVNDARIAVKLRMAGSNPASGRQFGGAGKAPARRPAKRDGARVRRDLALGWEAVPDRRSRSRLRRTGDWCRARKSNPHCFRNLVLKVVRLRCCIWIN